MGAQHWKSLLIAVAACAALAAPAGAQIGSRAYDRGFQEGVSQGERDARDHHAYNIEGNKVYRSADSGYDKRDGSRDWYRNEFRRGFSSGYREGYDRSNVAVRRYPNGPVYGDTRVYRNGRYEPGYGNIGGPRSRAGYQEPAFARGYSDGWQQGVDDGRDRDRYDPGRHGEYKSADHGYDRNYGSKDAYKNNYRSGFRQGYEEGYRNGNGQRR
jgi:hypothetical protein